jgi:hypothetical protein
MKKNVEELLEPHSFDNRPYPEQVLVSIAISLKRIADVAEMWAGVKRDRP